METALAKPETATAQGVLKQLSGPGKGREFELGAARITIGRAEGNHIVISDESISRVHAFIEQSQEGLFVVFDNQSRNGVQVNGKKIDASILHSRDSVQFGNIEFVFESLSGDPQLIESGNKLSRGGPVRKFAINKRVILYGGAGLVIASVLFLNNEKENPSKASSGKTGDKEVVAKLDIEQPPSFVPPPENGSEKIGDVTQNPVEKELESLSQGDSGVLESETYFRRGQREFFNKNYHRAINSFEVALSLNQNHPAAGYYLKSAIYQAEREAQRNFEMGLKYFESLQYQRAIYHFQQTQTLLAHKQKDPVLGQADKYIRLSRQRLQAAEMFP